MLMFGMFLMNCRLNVNLDNFAFDVVIKDKFFGFSFGVGAELVDMSLAVINYPLILSHCRKVDW
jgi:hypothetical protein